MCFSLDYCKCEFNITSIAFAPMQMSEVVEHSLFMKGAAGSIPIRGLVYFHFSFIVKRPDPQTDESAYLVSPTCNVGTIV